MLKYGQHGGRGRGSRRRIPEVLAPLALPHGKHRGWRVRGVGAGSTTDLGKPGRVSPRRPGANDELKGEEGVCPEVQRPARGHTGQARPGTPRMGGTSPLRLSSPSLLGQNLFDSIKSEPFSIPEDDGNDLTHTFFNPDREGWLLKLGETHTRAHADTRTHTRAHAGTHTH